MSLLADFLKGAADQFIVEDTRRRDNEEKRLEIKRQMAQREQERREDRKHQMATLGQTRRWQTEDRDEDRNREVLHTYTADDGRIIQRLGDGTERVVGTRTAAESQAEERRRRLEEANISLIERNARAPYATSGRTTEDKGDPISREDALFLAMAKLKKDDPEDPEVMKLAAELYSSGITRDDLPKGQRATLGTLLDRALKVL